MRLHAAAAIGDALVATARYRPRGLGGWLWVAAVATAVASPSIALPTGSGRRLADVEPGHVETFGALLTDAVSPVVAGAFDSVIGGSPLVVGVVALALWAALVAIGALLEFPFLRWLRDGEFAVHAELRRHWRRALGLAGVRLALGGGGATVVAGVVASAVGSDPTVLDATVVLGERWAVVAVVATAVGVVGALTTAFVVPTMALGDRGVLEGWRRVWPVVAGAPIQTIAYVGCAGLLAAAGGILVAGAAFLVALPVLAASIAVGLLVSPTAGVAVAAIGGGTALTLAVVLPYAAVQIYLRYHALFVLGDLDAELDLFPERRRAVREGTRAMPDRTRRAG